MPKINLIIPNALLDKPDILLEKSPEEGKPEGSLVKGVSLISFLSGNSFLAI